MRWTLPSKWSRLLAALVLLPALPALGQTTGMTSTDKGTCDGMVGMQAIAGNTYVTVDKSPILSNSGYVFSRAECECRTRDLGMRIEMTTPIPMGASGVGAELWVGAADCSVSTTRTATGTICEKSSAAITLSSFMSSAPIDLSLSSEMIPNPKTVNWMPMPDEPVWPYSCDVNGTSTRTFFVLLGDVTSSPATCKLPLAIDTTPPAAPQNISAANGDGAVTMRWDAPLGDNTQDIEFYQVLCRSKTQPMVPVKDAAFRDGVRYGYSVCLNGSMYRRPPPTQTANSPARPETGIPEPVAGQFPLHPAFICSDRIPAAGASAFSVRIDGLQNGSPYELLVVAIDKNGNPSTPTAQQIVAATPAPVVNPLGQYCESLDAADCPIGFGCALSDPRQTPRKVAPLSLAGLGLAVSGLLWARSRRRRDSLVPGLTRRSA